MNSSSEITRLVKIYNQIPKDFKCHHCHLCCGPIIWFQPEEYLIRKFLNKHKLDYIVWSENDFKKNNMRCPYLKDGKCIIYPVRPIVCRLQGHIPELPCKMIKDISFDKLKIKKIETEFKKLINDSGSVGRFYSTKRYY